jgi:redox-sensitive bicupin YhaK (pirin superfamily)
MGGFTIHANLPGRLIQGSNDHGYGPLAMVVESILVPGRLIKMHEHRNDEIISWVPAGVMRHNDRTVGELVTDSGHLMVMNAGRSFWHAERTLVTDPELRMLQIFVRPRALDLEPVIQHGPIAESPPNRWRHLFGPESGDAPFYVRNTIDFYDIRLEAGAEIAFPMREDRDLYFYVFTGAIEAGGLRFEEAEQGLLRGGGQLELRAAGPTLLVAFLIDPEAVVTREGTVGR